MELKNKYTNWDSKLGTQPEFLVKASKPFNDFFKCFFYVKSNHYLQVLTAMILPSKFAIGWGECKLSLAVRLVSRVRSRVGVNVFEHLPLSPGVLILLPPYIAVQLETEEFTILT